MEAESVPERAESLAKVLVRFKEMTLSLWQVMPYQWQWLVDGVHVERRLEGSRVMEFLKLRRDNASLGKRIEEVMRGGLVKEEKKKIRSHGRGIVIIVVKKESSVAANVSKCFFVVSKRAKWEAVKLCLKERKRLW